MGRNRESDEEEKDDSAVDRCSALLSGRCTVEADVRDSSCACTAEAEAEAEEEEEEERREAENDATESMDAAREGEGGGSLTARVGAKAEVE